jgi:hypothetical protein
LKHSAKPYLHSAKALPSVALGKGHTVKKTVGKAFFAKCLLSGFAECLTLGKV